MARSAVLRWKDWLGTVDGVEESERRNQEAEADHKTANERSAALRDEQNGLPSRIAEAESRLENEKIRAAPAISATHAARVGNGPAVSAPSG